MSSNVMTGFCRITVVAPNVRVDVALPEDVPLAELMPDVLRMTDQWQAEGAHAGFALTRLGSGSLDTSLSLTAQGVRSGDLLYLRPVAETLPPAVYDDVVDVIASSITEGGRAWGAGPMRAAGLGAGTVLLVLGAAALWFSGHTATGGLDPHGVPAIAAGVVALLLLVAGAVRSRVYSDATSGTLIGGVAVLYGFVAGAGILPISVTSGLGRTHFAVGCGVALVLAVVGAVLQEEHDEVFVATAITAGVGTVAAICALLSDATPVRVAAVTGAIGLAGVGFMPGLVARFARFPMPNFTDGTPRVTTEGQTELPEGDDSPVDVERVRAQTLRGTQILAGLVGACALVMTFSAIVLAFGTHHAGGGVYAEVLALVLGLGAIGRARLFQLTPQVTPLVTGGVVSLVFLTVGVGLHSSSTAREGWLFAALLLAALIALVVGLRLPNRTLTPGWGRTVDLLEGLLLASVIPLVLAVLDLYSTLRTVV